MKGILCDAFGDRASLLAILSEDDDTSLVVFCRQATIILRFGDIGKDEVTRAEQAPRDEFVGSARQ